MTEDETAALSGLDGLGARLRDAAGGLAEAERAAGRLADVAGAGLARALEQAVNGGGRFSASLRDLAQDFARATLRQSLKPVGAAVSGALDGVFGQVFSGLGGAVRAFAKGGVVDRATGFAMPGGVGVMGEAGPEAILPLARGADGKLGVRGGGSVAVTINVSTPDAESFRRSQGQIVASLARAVEQGRRRM